MKLVYKGKEVADIKRIGYRFIQCFIFPDQGYDYRWHKVTFSYENIKSDKADLKPVKLEKTICDYETIDEYGFREHFKTIKQPLSMLKELTKDVDLWGNVNHLKGK